jgi:hypothetical protein
MKPTFSLLTIPCLAAFMMVGATAHADTFTFTLTGNGGYGPLSGGGTLTAVADPTLPGVDEITGISGNIDGITISGILPCATYDVNTPCSTTSLGVGYDNLLYPGGTGIFGLTFLDYRGIGFSLADGGEADVNASSSHLYTFVFANTPPGASTPEVGGFSITPVPEPSNFLLLGTGLLGIVRAVRRRIGSRRWS